jgi:Spy/CpxP family protein refolding chaperone
MFFVFLTAIGLFALGAFFGKRRGGPCGSGDEAFGFVGGGGHGCGWRRGHGHRRWHRHGHGHHHGFDEPRGPFWARGILENLEATPSQRRAIHEAIRELKVEMRGLRDSVFSSRGDLAQALRDEHLDVDALGATLAGGDDAVDRVRTAVSGFVAKLHGILDEEQRARLADLIERRGFGGFGRGFGPGWA